MTEATTTPQPPKKMWTRCNGCQDRIYNDPHDIKIHAQHCPQDILLALQKLRLAVLGDPNIPKDPNSLLARTTRLEETVGDLDEHISTEPSLDPDGIDLDAFTDVVGSATAANDDDDDDDDPRSTYADDDYEPFPQTTTALAEAPLSAVSGLYNPNQVNP